jgi:sulfite oxidase
MTVARRTLFQRLFQTVAAGALWQQRLPPAHAEGDETQPIHTGPLTVRVARPFDAETPVREFLSRMTPNHRFFVRSHFGPPSPDRITEANWTLNIGGLVERPHRLTLKEIQRFPAGTLTAVVQCSGNGRANFQPKVPGVQWDRGAAGNAEWTGVRLKDVLESCGVQPGGQHVQFQGADRPVLDSVPLFIRSIPLDKALHPDTLLAYEMNGQPLPLLHGAPLRVITPGWMAESCIKWLTDIVVQQEEAQGYYMQTAYRVPEGDRTVPVEEMPVKSLIAAPAAGDSVGKGPVIIRGVAWAGEAAVIKVEVSTDEGATWETARLLGEDRPYGWRQWQYVWKPRTPGPATILCRATDARGAVQPAASPWNPSGFLWNGWDRVTVIVGALS